MHQLYAFQINVNTTSELDSFSDEEKIERLKNGWVTKNWQRYFRYYSSGMKDKRNNTDLLGKPFDELHNMFMENRAYHVKPDESIEDAAVLTRTVNSYYSKRFDIKRDTDKSFIEELEKEYRHRSIRYTLRDKLDQYLERYGDENNYYEEIFAVSYSGEIISFDKDTDYESVLSNVEEEKRINYVFDLFVLMTIQNIFGNVSDLIKEVFGDNSQLALSVANKPLFEIDENFEFTNEHKHNRLQLFDQFLQKRATKVFWAALEKLNVSVSNLDWQQIHEINSIAEAIMFREYADTFPFSTTHDTPYKKWLCYDLTDYDSSDEMFIFIVDIHT